MEMLVEKTRGGGNVIKDAPAVLCRDVCEQFSNCDACPIQKVIDKLAKYEQQESKGLLLHVPCKEGEIFCMPTGIHAAEEKIIYEYDIIKHYNNQDSPDSFTTGIVVWDEVKAGFKVFHLTDLTAPYSLHDGYRYEVVGSIFDHPEFSDVIVKAEKIHPALNKVKKYLNNTEEEVTYVRKS